MCMKHTEWTICLTTSTRLADGPVSLPRCAVTQWKITLSTLDAIDVDKKIITLQLLDLSVSFGRFRCGLLRPDLPNYPCCQLASKVDKPQSYTRYTQICDFLVIYEKSSVEILGLLKPFLKPFSVTIMCLTTLMLYWPRPEYWVKIGPITRLFVSLHSVPVKTEKEQEAQLSPRVRAMRRVSWNLASCHATAQKLLVRQVLNQVSAVANWPVRQNRAVDSAWRSVR